MVASVKDLFDSLDQCTSKSTMEEIINEIDDSSEKILPRNCCKPIFDDSLNKMF